MLEPHHKNLLARAQRAFGNVSPEEAIKKSRAIVGPAVIPGSAKAARSAMEKLALGTKPTPEELIALEYVIRVMRPAPLVVNGELSSLSNAAGNLHPPETVERWNRFRKAVHPLLRSVGRVDHPTLGQIGTGFLVSSGVLATNRHVLDQLSGGAGVVPNGAFVRFVSEVGATEQVSTKVALTGVVDVHAMLDIALLAMGPGEDRPPMTLDIETKIENGHPVAVVGFPVASFESNPLFSEAIFQGKYGVKRGAMGEILDPNELSFFHDCTTLNGNSGSPVFSLISHDVIGIHRSGAYLFRNEGIAAREIRSLIAN